MRRRGSISLPNGASIGSTVDYDRASDSGDANYQRPHQGEEPVEPADRRQWADRQAWSITLELGGVLDRFQTIGGVMFRF